MRDGTTIVRPSTKRPDRLATKRARLAHRVLGWVIPGVIVVATIVAFLPTLRNGFVSWDDDRNFVENPHFRGLGGQQLHWMWTTFHMGHYVPLSWMTLGLDYELWGMNPTGYHLTSLLFHAANAVIVYFIARWAFARTIPAETPGAHTLAAAAGALFFALHPLRVESVAWATERRDVLSGLFFLASILIYARSRGTSTHRRQSMIALALFVCALLSKATAMSLPAVLFVLNVYPLRRLGGDVGWWTKEAWAVYVELAPFALLALVAAGLSIIALHPPSQLGVAAKLAVSAYSLVFYLWKTVLPIGLAPLYEMPQRVDAGATRFVASGAIVIGLALAAWLLRRRWPGLTTSLVLFLLVTLPMLGVVQNGPQIAADRYTYHAAPAIAILFGAALIYLRRLSAPASGIAGSLVILTVGTLTWQQSEIWHDSRTLWNRVLEIDDRSSIAHSAMSNVLYRENRVEEGLEHSRRAVEIAPNYPDALNGLGVGLAREGRAAEAIATYERAVALRPTFDEAETNWGVSLVQLGDIAGAIDHYRKALAINPDDSNAHVNWGNALVRLNRPNEAIPHYEAALAIRPDNADAQHNWGVALARQQRFPEAIEHFRAALTIDPDHVEAREYLDTAMRLLRTRTDSTAR